MNVISAIAPAKINLYLHVTGKDRNNYHLLDSMMVFIDVQDIIEVTAATDIKVVAKGEYAHCITEQDNLVKKTAIALQKHFKIKSGAAITLHKNIPVGAGLGGGSADAAATLKLLLRLWKVNASQEDLLSIALSLGADVPACLLSTSLYASGIGEITEPAPKLPKLHLLLVNPGKPLLTKDVFAKYPGKFSKAITHPKDFLSKTSFLGFLNQTRNDLQETAIQLIPEIGTLLNELTDEKDCLLARMSGSGATCFGIFTKRLHAENIAMQLSHRHPEWWVRTASLI
jgi:4-diphosphocytidyl-2-C-methyl-D-erythritol kinase